MVSGWIVFYRDIIKIISRLSNSLNGIWIFMKLRVLRYNDAPLMYEWMRDEEIIKYFYDDFSHKTLKDAEEYINSIPKCNDVVSYAIASDEDEYMGTACLKSIDREKGYAQMSVVVRRCAMTRGYSWFAVCELLRIAFDELNLESVYWCISNRNNQAVRFYDKHYFNRIVDVPFEIREMYHGREDLIWYSVLKGDDFLNEALNRGNVAGCKIIRIKTIPTVNAGELSFFEAGHDINFDIKRIYYISKVPEGMRRGFHAHKKLKQLLYCPYGQIQLILDNGTVREEITLNDPSIGIVIDYPVWREMLWLQKDSVLCVASSEFYDVEDYIRDYGEFIDFTDKELEVD